MGGTCALDLSVRRPELFSAFVDIAGDVGPNSGNKAQTIARLFGGDANAWAAFDPATVIARHGQYSGVAGLFEIAARSEPGNGPDISNPEGQDHAAEVLSMLSAAHGVMCSVLRLPGRHDWPFAAHALGAALPWLAGQLGTPGVPPVPLPGAPTSQHVANTATPPLAQSHRLNANGG
jgi:S-formylglutathione hydrolase FrmB